jgi:hypothetical protein
LEVNAPATTASIKSGNFTIQSTSAFSSNVTNNTYFDGANWKYIATGAISLLGIGAGYFTVYSAVSGSAGGNASLVNDFAITPSGYMSIGAGTSPTYPIVLKKDGVLASGNWYNLASFTNAAQTKGVNLGYDNSSQTGIIGSHSSGTATNLAFWIWDGSGWGESMRLTSTSRLGVGTAAPDSGFHVATAKTWTTAGWGKVMTLGASGSAPALQFGFGSGTRWGIGNSGGSLYFFTNSADDASAAANYVSTWTGADVTFLVPVVGTTLTGRVIPRVFGTSSTATLTPEIATYDAFNISNQAAGLTIANHSTSTPNNFETMKIRIKDNGTPQTISYGSNYVDTTGTTRPTTTVASTMMEMIFEWNASTNKWMLISLI